MTTTAAEPVDTGISDSDAVAQLVASMTPPKGDKEPAASDATDPDEEDDEDLPPPSDDDEDEGEGGADEGDDEDEEEADGLPTPPPSKAAEPAKVPEPPADDTVIKVTVDGQETEHTLGSLKQLATQAASVTKKDEEAEALGGRAAAALEGALNSILEDLAPYKDVDWVLEGQRMEPDEFVWHRENFTRLQARYQRVVGAAKDFDAASLKRRQTASEDQARNALTALKDPTTGIAGFDDKLYGDIKGYGVSMGLDADDVANITSPAVIKIIHKAMMFDKGQKAAAEKVNQAPQRVRRSSGREAIAPEATKSQARLEKKIASGTATDDDAITALLGRWGVTGN